jgi:hypothetical protein
MQLSVLLQGALYGMGREGSCELVARRIPTPEPGRFRFTDVVIIHAPFGFPDGDYTLRFEGIQLPASHRRMQWTVQTPRSRGLFVIYEESLAGLAADLLREMKTDQRP